MFTIGFSKINERLTPRDKKTSLIFEFIMQTIEIIIRSALLCAVPKELLLFLDQYCSTENNV
jgi:hypothetical protein